MTNILITGETGFVGKHLVTYIEDITDWHINDGGSYDYIINLASGSSVEKSITNPDGLIEDNISCLLDTLEQTRNDENPKAFIHVSTVEAVRPTNPYAASKAAQEAICIAYRETYKLPIVIVRSHNIIGSGQRSEKFIPKLIEKIKAGETIDIYGNGSRVYNPVENICSALVHLLQEDITSGTYLVQGGERKTNLEMARLIARHLELPLKHKMVKGRPGYARALRGEGKKIPNWTPPQTLDESLSWV